MNALDFLIHEHQSHKNLISQVELDSEAWKTLREELIHHVNMEEAVFYPNLLRLEELETTVREAWEEHNLIMQLLQELDQLQPHDDAWFPKFEVLRKILLLHIDEEENKLFPEIRKLASEDFLIDVGEQMEVQKASMNPQEILYPEVEGSHKIS